ncbi:MAG: HlyD family secretion protein [Verrucomicrobium sp.]|nr:HlyD family secretion protein [Verrucomicrobium sp.]
MSQPHSHPHPAGINQEQAETNRIQAQTNRELAKAQQQAPAKQGEGGEKKDGEAKKAEPPSPRARKALAVVKQPKVWIPAAAVLFLILLGLVYHAFTHESTDDAYTTGHVHNIASRVAGTVIEVRVDDNERVRKGQILVVLDPTDYQVQVNQARADYEKAQADYNRLLPLRGDAAISQQDFDNATALMQTTKARLEDALNQLDYCTIRAPSDGRVGHKDVEAGNRLTVGGALMAVVEDIWVVANFKETQLAKMRVGQKVDVEVDAIPGKTFEGTVDSISPGSGSTFALLPPDNATGNFTKIVQRVPVKVRFDADSIRGYEGRLVPGLSCVPSVSLHGGRDKNDLAPERPEREAISSEAAR